MPLTSPPNPLLTPVTAQMAREKASFEALGDVSQERAGRGSWVIMGGRLRSGPLPRHASG